MSEKEKKVEETKEETLTEEEKAQKREETKKAILEEIKKKVIKDSGMSQEDAEIALQMLDEANMPVLLSDEEFTLGPRELDIRKLNQENFNQLIFRTLLLQGVYLRNISKSLLDITNLLFVELDALGVENIVKASDEIILKVARENERREKQQKNKN